MNDPKRLQELISSNALIGAFLGESVHEHELEDEDEDEHVHEHEHGNQHGHQNAIKTVCEPLSTRTVSSSASSSTSVVQALVQVQVQVQPASHMSRTISNSSNRSNASNRSASQSTSQQQQQQQQQQRNHNDNDNDNSNDNNNDNSNDKEETKTRMILNSISTSYDIESLMDGISSDLQFFIQHCQQDVNASSSSSSSSNANMWSNSRTYNRSNSNSNSNSDSHSQNKNTNDTSPTTTTTTTTTNVNVSSSHTNTDINNTNGHCNTNPDDTGTTVPIQEPTQVPIQVPIQLQTLVCRISRIKALLYDENDNNETTTTNSNTNTNQQPNFIQQLLPLISNSNDYDYHNPSSNPTSSSPSSSLPTNYNPTENAQKVLKSILKNKQSRTIIIPTLLQYIHILPFEIRKHVSSIFNYLLVNSSDTLVRMEFMFYVYDYFDCIMDTIVFGHFVGGSNSSSRSSTNSNDTSTGNADGDKVVLDGTGTTTISTKGNMTPVDDTTDKVAAETTSLANNNDNNDTPSGGISTSTPPVPPPPTTTTATTFKTPDVALHCGSMLRSIIRHPTLYAKLVNNETYVQKYIYPFLDSLVNQPNFEIASDALETLRLILHPMDMDLVLPHDPNDDDNDHHNVNDDGIDGTCNCTDDDDDDDDDGMDITISPYSTFTQYTTSIINNRLDQNTIDLLSSTSTSDPSAMDAKMEKISSTFLQNNYKSIFEQRFNPKLLSPNYANYITRRVSLQLLSSILLTRSNYNIMIQYVSSKRNLRTIMILLRDPSAYITLEAFHVFKIFVANPNKTKEVMRILGDNKVKLIRYLTGLHKEREEMDEQFHDEKILVISTLEHLEL